VTPVAAGSPKRSPLLLVIALFGLTVPNGLFVCWLVRRHTAGIGDILNDPLALGFMLDAFMAMLLLAWWFARSPIGPLRWPWFIVLSLVGGLGFSLPMYWWLNDRR
jgi:hypothetical protein